MHYSFTSNATVKCYWVTHESSATLITFQELLMSVFSPACKLRPFVSRKRPSFKGIGSAGGTHLQRLNTAFMWDCICPLGGVRVPTSWCGFTTPATSLTSKIWGLILVKERNKLKFCLTLIMILFSGWRGKQSSQHLTWTGCTHPSSLHVWRVTLLTPSSLFKQPGDLHTNPQQQSLHHLNKMHTPQPV